MNGAILPFQLLYAGKTTRCHPKYAFPSEFDIWHTPNHWATGETVIRLVSNVIVPYVNVIRLKMKLTSTHPAIVIYDAFKGHQGNDLQKLLHDNHLLSAKIPSNCTDRLQPIDISINKPVKDHLRKCFTSWYTEQVQKQLLNGTVVEDVKVDLHLLVMKQNGLFLYTTTFVQILRLDTIASNKQDLFMP